MSGEPEQKKKDVDLGGYIDVAERIQLFYEQFPEGRLQGGPVNVSAWGLDASGVLWYKAEAYRSPEDPLPGIGWASEPLPGKTPFTRDSELMNAETSAWGRAIAALGIGTSRGIASKQEVQSRAGGGGGEEPAASDKQRDFLGDLIGKAEGDGLLAPGDGKWFDFFQARTPIADLKRSQASRAIELFKQRPDDLAQQLDELVAPSGEAADDDIPF